LIDRAINHQDLGKALPNGSSYILLKGRLLKTFWSFWKNQKRF